VTHTAPRVLVGSADAPLKPPVQSGITFERDADHLLRRVEQQAFDFVFVDPDLPRLTLVLLKDLTKKVSRTFTIRGALIQELTEGFGTKEPWEHLNAFLVGTAPSASNEAPSRLVCTRSPEEVADLERQALQIGFAERNKILERSMSTQEVADLLGTSRQTPHDRVKAKTLLGVEHNGSLRFPTWQFDPAGANGVVNGLGQVLKVLDVSPFAQARWLQLPNSVLGGQTPLDALKAGRLDEVIAEARGVGAVAGAPGG